MNYYQSTHRINQQTLIIKEHIELHEGNVRKVIDLQ